MRRLKLISQVSCLVLAAGILGVIGCKNGNLFGDRNKPGNSSDVAVLQSDAQIALDHKDYSSALSLYERILAGNPNNSNALNGAAIAAIGAGGLDFGTVLANIVHQNGTSSIMGLGDMIASARNGVSGQGAPSGSILSGINLAALDGVIDLAICRLTKIAAGMTDNTIKSTDIAMLADLGCLHFIRGVLRPIEAGYFDIQNTGGSFKIVLLADANAVCGNPANNGLVVASAQDFVDAYVLFNRATDLLGSSSSTIIGRLRQEMDDAISDALTPGGNFDLPAACVTTINNAGITAANFRSNTHAFQPVPGC